MNTFASHFNTASLILLLLALNFARKTLFSNASIWILKWQSKFVAPSTLVQDLWRQIEKVLPTINLFQYYFLKFSYQAKMFNVLNILFYDQTSAKH